MAIRRSDIGDWRDLVSQLGRNDRAARHHVRTRRRFSCRLGLFASHAVRRVLGSLFLLGHSLRQEVKVRYRCRTLNWWLDRTARQRCWRVPSALRAPAAAQPQR